MMVCSATLRRSCLRCAWRRDGATARTAGVSVAPLRDGDGDGGGAARRLVSELMLLAGEAVAQYAEDEGVPLVYRRQAMREIDAAEVDELPAGPPRGRCSAARRRRPPARRRRRATRASASIGTRSARRRSAISATRDPPPDQGGAARRDPALLGRRAPHAVDAQAGRRRAPARRAANARWLTEFLRRRAGSRFAPSSSVPTWTRDGARSRCCCRSLARSSTTRARATSSRATRFRSRPTGRARVGLSYGSIQT